MTTYKLVMPEDMKHYGFLVGGRLLSLWLTLVVVIAGCGHKDVDKSAEALSKALVAEHRELVEARARCAMLADRNRMQEDYLVRIAKTIEKMDIEETPMIELLKDSDPVEAKIIDLPNTVDLLGDYDTTLEVANLDTFQWDNQKDRGQLRMVYVLDVDGKPVMNGNEPLMTGNGTEDELLSTLLEAAKDQQVRLNTIRAELASLRGKLEAAINDINKMKPEMRQDKVTLEEKKREIARLEAEKGELEAGIAKKKGNTSGRTK